MHPQGCHSASPESRLEEPKTRGKGGAVYPSTLVVALGWVVRPQGSYDCVHPFPAGRSGAFAPSDAGAI